MRLREADGEATWLQLWCNRNSKTGPLWCNPNWLVLTHLMLYLMFVCIFRKRLNGIPQVWPVHDYRRRTGQCLQDLWQGLFGSVSQGSQGKGSPDMVQWCSMVFNGVQCARTKVAPSMPLSSRMCFASWAFLWIPCSNSVELSWKSRRCGLDPDISVWLLNHQLRKLHKRSTSFMHSMCIFWGLKRWSKQPMMTIAAQLQVEVAICWATRRLESLTGYTRKSIYAVPKHEFRQFPKLCSLLWTTAKPQVVSASTESLCGKSLSFDSIGHWTAWCCFYVQNLPCTKWTWCCFVGLFDSFSWV